MPPCIAAFSGDDELAHAAQECARCAGQPERGHSPVDVQRLAESPGESLLRLRLLRMGLDLIEQHSMPWVEGNPRVDFLVEGCLVVEFDGRGSTNWTAIRRAPTGRRSVRPRPDRRGRQWRDPRDWAELWDEPRSAAACTAPSAGKRPAPDQDPPAWLRSSMSAEGMNDDPGGWSPEERRAARCGRGAGVSRGLACGRWRGGGGLPRGPGGRSCSSRRTRSCPRTRTTASRPRRPGCEWPRGRGTSGRAR